MIQVLVSALLLVGLIAPRTLYRAGTDTASPGDTAPSDTAPIDSGSASDTGDSAATTDTASTDTADSGLDEGPLWGAAALSGEPGGCGCASVPLAQGYGAGLSGLAALALVRRRRR